jgi:uncharacterized membrane protein YccC
MLLATIFAGLLAASPNPTAAATRTLYGYAGGMAAGFVAVFVLLPGSDGFVMLICATAGLLLIGPYLSTRDTLPGVGAGYTLGFVYILALKNPMVYDPTHFLNDAIAQVADWGCPAWPSWCCRASPARGGNAGASCACCASRSRWRRARRWKAWPGASRASSATCCSRW